MGQAIAQSVGVKVEHIPYKLTQQALSDIVAGHVPFSTFTLSSTAQFLRAGQLNGVAVTTAERLPDYSNIPTFKELGHPNLVGTTWFSMSGPAKLPKDIVDGINAEITNAVAKPEVQEAIPDEWICGAAGISRGVYKVRCCRNRKMAADDRSGRAGRQRGIVRVTLPPANGAERSAAGC